MLQPESNRNCVRNYKIEDSGHLFYFGKSIQPAVSTFLMFSGALGMKLHVTAVTCF